MIATYSQSKLPHSPIAIVAVTKRRIYYAYCERKFIKRDIFWERGSNESSPRTWQIYYLPLDGIARTAEPEPWLLSTLRSGELLESWPHDVFAVACDEDDSQQSPTNAHPRLFVFRNALYGLSQHVLVIESATGSIESYRLEGCLLFITPAEVMEIFYPVH
jgi:hypothetical protein